jgi:hypothetical protein
MRKLQNAMVMSLVVVGMLTLGLARPTPALAAAETLTVNTTQTLGSVQFYSCAGEYIALSGDYHALFHVTFDPTGGTHVVGAHNSQGIRGVGLQSGTLFRAADGDRRTTNIFGAPGFETTYVDAFRLIGQGESPDLLVYVTMHVTFAPDQGFTAQVSNVSSECR